MKFPEKEFDKWWLGEEADPDSCAEWGFEQAKKQITRRNTRLANNLEALRLIYISSLRAKSKSSINSKICDIERELRCDLK